MRVVLGAVERLPAVVGDLGDLLQAPLRHIGEPRQVQRHPYGRFSMSRNMRHESASEKKRGGRFCRIVQGESPLSKCPLPRPPASPRS